MILLIVLGHLDACVFWCIERYLPAGSRWIDQKNLVTDPETLEPVTMASQYFVSIIGSLESLVLDLRQVSEPREYVAVLFEFMFGILAYGTVFGTITNVLHMADSAATMAQQEEQHKYEIKGMKEYMWDKGIRPELQEKVLSYKELQWRRIQGLNECDLFADLPKNLQQQIQDSLYLDLVKQVPLFQEMDPAILSMIAYCITPLVVMDKWFVYEAGDEAAEMYFIKAGSIEILAGDTCIGLLEPGNFFGETALWGGEETGRSARRITSARAVSGDVELCVLANEDFEILQESFPELKKRIQDLIDVRDRRAQEKLEEDRLRAESEQLMASHSPLKHQKTKKPRPLTDILKRINPGGSTDQLHQNSGVHTSSPVSPVSHDFQSIMHLGSPLASVSEPQSDAQTSHGHNSPSQSGGTIAGQPVSSMPPIPYPAYAQTSAGRESIASSSAKERELALSREQLASREHPIARENTATGRSLRTRTQSLIGPRHAGDRSK
ncbi:cyclic nucleotide-binding-like protein [Polychytrium aggregatum]|uniref:cyclic nucleotide-binding-like protein n=1 Tax=Polychytrium aggregatum TaxID=110093 RepID=UPI0022FE5016|nr:cyclic nucleotide-binding-like protein [Polychytrium aggregatum]KAI9201922.1 cyclic nucleotide-binding-like protein [Polychytrium aggregatum]